LNEKRKSMKIADKNNEMIERKSMVFNYEKAFNPLE
jgi:hypothetical protein